MSFHVPRVFVLLALPAAAAAQPVTFYNTERGRPFTVEDAAPIPRSAFDLSLRPAWQNSRGGTGQWSVEPGVTYGLLSRTQLEVRIPVRLSSDVAWDGVYLGAQHTLNVESRVMPLLALDGTILVPAGSTDNAHPLVAGLATKTFSWGRLSVNSEALLGDEPATPPASGRLMRWQSGAAVDRIFSRGAWLAGLELLASQPLEATLPVAWSGAAGVRYQLDPAIVIDAGFSHQLSGGTRTWRVTAGVSRLTPAASLLPGLGRWGR